MLRSRTLREGTVGLFALLGLVVIGGFAIWLRGGGVSQDSYQILVDFEDVSGLQIGAPVRYRGVDVGKIVDLAPGSNRVGVTLEIASGKLKIPRKSAIKTSRYGLLGEASIDIEPPPTTLSPQALTLDPNSKDCDQKYGPIICNQARLQGAESDNLVASMTKLSNVYSDPVFVSKLGLAAANTAKAGEQIAQLSAEMRMLTVSARQQIQGVSQAVATYTLVGKDASQFVRNVNGVVTRNQAQLDQAIANAAQLSRNLNVLVTENRSQLVATLGSVQQTSDEMRQVAKSLNQSVTQVNQGLNTVDIQKIAKDIETLVANATIASGNLRDLSKNINDPALLLNLQKTLDSARFTMENVQKITSDLDDLTGDPAFRDNIRRLINGLGNLMSSTQQIEQQVYTSHLLEAFSNQLDYQRDVQQRLAVLYREAPQPTAPTASHPPSPLLSPSPAPRAIAGGALSTFPPAPIVPLTSARQASDQVLNQGLNKP